MGCSNAKSIDPADVPVETIHPELADVTAMPEVAKKYLLVKPADPPPLDPGFAPLVLGKRKYLKATANCKDKLQWAILRPDGVARYSLPVFDDGHPDVEASVYLAGVLIQEMLWQRGGNKLLLSGPLNLCSKIEFDFSELKGRYSFEALQMPKVCGRPDLPFTVAIVKASELPEPSDTPQVCGKDANGCRLAFDLGKSDIKTVAVKDNEVLFSQETEWDVTNEDPDYHYNKIKECLLVAKEKLGGHVDAIGGSATGTISGDNGATWCDIFPNVPPEVYKQRVVDIFRRLAKEVAGDVPLKVINDGEVTALAAVKKVGAGNVLGISMGSSEGAGYADANGNLLGWINELCYVRLDMNPEAPTDPWTKGSHTGISHMYLGQRAATRLAAKAGIQVPANQVYPHEDMCNINHEIHADCLKNIQQAMKELKNTAPHELNNVDVQKPTVLDIYATVGTYLGFALAQYSEFYKIDHVMILGRVSKGDGGEHMLRVAKEVLDKEFPELKGIQFHTADERFKAVGQCIAAAALPYVDLSGREEQKGVQVEDKEEDSAKQRGNGACPCGTW